MKIPDNIYMNICKVFQELYKNKFVPNELNIAEVGSRGKNMTCRYRITVPEEMESVTFSYYDRRREGTFLQHKRQDTEKRAEASGFPGKTSEYYHRH